MVNTDIKVQLAFRGADLGDVDMEVADGVCLELLLRLLVPSNFGQSADPVALQTAVQRRACQERDRCLQCVEAVVQRQQCMPTEGNDDGLFFDSQDSGLGVLGAGGEVMR